MDRSLWSTGLEGEGGEEDDKADKKSENFAPIIFILYDNTIAVFSPPFISFVYLFLTLLGLCFLGRHSTT
jgi:hypothetical protein